MYKVKISFEDNSIPEETFEASDGDSVLDVALDNGIELHHNCGAVCACSTCHVYIQKGMESLPDITEKEEDFIDRAINPAINSRLACQCLIKGDIEVTIPDQRQFHGH
jgi:ferredoxin, 2Fe-2S